MAAYCERLVSFKFRFQEQLCWEKQIPLKLCTVQLSFIFERTEFRNHDPGFMVHLVYNWCRFKFLWISLVRFRGKPLGFILLGQVR